MYLAGCILSGNRSAGEGPCRQSRSTGSRYGPRPGHQKGLILASATQGSIASAMLLPIFDFGTHEPPKQKRETVDFCPTRSSIPQFRTAKSARKCFGSPFVDLQHHILARVCSPTTRASQKIRWSCLIADKSKFAPVAAEPQCVSYHDGYPSARQRFTSDAGWEMQLRDHMRVTHNGTPLTLRTLAEPALEREDARARRPTLQ